MTSSQQQHAAADRLWQRFGEMFGSRFFESYGQKPSESWKEAVKELRNDQVKTALAKVRNGGSPHPPSLPEFLSLAKNVRPVELRTEPPKPFDWYQGFGQHTLLRFLVLTTQDVDETLLTRLVVIKNKLLEQCRAANGKEEAEEWRALMLDEFAKAMPVVALPTGRRL